MANQSFDNLRKLRNEYRANVRKPFELSDFIDFAHQQGHRIREDDLKWLVEQDGRNMRTFVMPEWVVSFLRRYVRKLNPSSILDPSAGLGFSIAGVSKGIEANVTALVSLDSEYDIVTKTYEGSSIRWELVSQPNVFSWLGNQSAEFDVIVSAPPFGVRFQPQWHDNGEKTGLRDDWSRLLLANASMKLSTNGVGIFLETASFFFNSRVREHLANYNLYLNAALALAAGTFAPATGIPGNLVIVSHQKSDNLFVAELTDNDKRNQGVLNLLLQRKASSNPTIGSLVPVEDFRSYQSLIEQRRVEDMAARLGLQRIPLSEVALEINKIDTREDIVHYPNSVYLPTRPGPAYILPDELTANQYFQIVLDPNTVNADYLVRLFNSDLGKMLRKTVESGSTIPNIRKSAIEGLPIFIPELPVQNQIVETDIRATSVISDLTELREQLWTTLQVDSEPASKIQKIVGAERDEAQRFEGWIDSLPFPLASILWAYHATNDNFKKYRLLLRYFEGLAQFLAVTLLSGFYNDDEWIAQERNLFFYNSDANEPQSKLRETSFGTWKSIVERLIKVLHEKLDDPTDKLRCEQLFCASEEVIRRVLPSEIVEVLAKTNSLRNLWRGHGGIDDKAAESRLYQLEEHLNETRQILGRRWEDYRLIRPTTSRISAGVVHQTVELLTGHHNPFVSTVIRIDEGLDDTFLYFHAVDEPRALKVQPLIKILDKLVGSEQASYFYSRMKQEHVVFISHHFESEPDITRIFKDTIDVINSILRDNGV